MILARGALGTFTADGRLKAGIASAGDTGSRIASVKLPAAAHKSARRDPPGVLLAMAAAYRQEGTLWIFPHRVEREELELQTPQGRFLPVSRVCCPTCGGPEVGHCMSWDMRSMPSEHRLGQAFVLGDGTQ